MAGRFTPIRFLSGVARSVAWFASTSVRAARDARRDGDSSNLDYVYASTLSRGFVRSLGLTYRVKNEERLTASQPCVYVVNHRSNLDLITLARIFPPGTIVIGKKQVLKVPLFGTIFEQGGNITIDRKNRDDARAGFDAAEKAILDDKRSIWVFPEGTRNHGRKLLPFKKGAFHLARNTGVPLVPIVCAAPDSWIDPKTLYLAREVFIVIHVLAPIDPAAFGSVDELAAHTWSVMNEALTRAAEELSAGSAEAR